MQKAIKKDSCYSESSTVQYHLLNNSYIRFYLHSKLKSYPRQVVNYALSSINFRRFSNSRTPVDFLEYTGDFLRQEGSFSPDITRRLKRHLKESSKNWDLSNISVSQTQNLVSALRNLKLIDLESITSLQRQFDDAFQNTLELSFNDTFLIVETLILSNYIDSSFLEHTYERLTKKYTEDFHRTERKIANLAWLYTYCNHPHEPTASFINKQITELCRDEKHSVLKAEASAMSKIALYLAYNYQNTSELHEQFIIRLANAIGKNRQRFIQSLERPKYFAFLWNWFQSIQIYNTDLFDSYKTNVIRQVPFQYNEQKSSFHQTLLEAVLKTGYPGVEIKKEHLVGIYRADFLLPGKRVIEFNGPFHYINDGERCVGNDVIRARNLTALGYECTEIPFYVWNNLPTDEDKLLYIKSKCRD